MALTAEQLADLQGFLGIDDSEAVFTDAELQRLFVLSGENFNGAVYLGWLQILGGATKWIDYKVAQTSISRNQAWQHVREMVALWGGESKSADDQLLSAGLNGIPTKHKPRPADDTRRHGYFKRGRWYPYANN